MHQPDPQSRSYEQLLFDIQRGALKIPQFQRDFVWSREKSARLVDSILKGYPIGTFIIWKTREQLRFVRNIGGQQLPATPKGDYAEHVLDGQQRLTSLYAACRGLTITREGRQDDFREIFVDLDLDSSEDPERSIVSTDATEDVAEAGRDGRFVRLVDLLGGKFDLLASLTANRRERLQEYGQRIRGYRFSVILIQDAPIDVATEVFTRINVSGQSLSVFEIMVAKTYDHGDGSVDSGFDLATRFNALSARLEGVNYDTLPSSAVLQLASLLMTGECTRKHILRLDTTGFRTSWKQVEDAVERAVDFFRTYFRIPVSKLLPYSALIVPFGYFFAKHPDTPLGVTAERLRELFWRISLSGRYSAAVEARLAADIKRVEAILDGQEPTYDFGVDISPDGIQSAGYFQTSRSFVKSVLCLYAFHQPESFANGSKVLIANDWLKRANSKNYHHFFPKAFLEKRAVEWRRINHVANITIVDDYLNKRRIGARAPSTYLAEWKDGPHFRSSMKTHLIDDPVRFGVFEDDYETFLTERCKTISSRLQQWVPSRDIDKVGVHAFSDFDPDDLPEEDAHEAA